VGLFKNPPEGGTPNAFSEEMAVKYFRTELGKEWKR
jgi:hypothetical protein